MDWKGRPWEEPEESWERSEGRQIERVDGMEVKDVIVIGVRWVELELDEVILKEVG